MQTKTTPQENDYYFSTINLENIDYSNYSMRIDSPRSIRICAERGIKTDDLYFFNFFQYRQMHPELIPLSLEIQRSHYYHDEGVRKETINALIAARRKEMNSEEIKQTEFIGFNDPKLQEEGANHYPQKDQQEKEIGNDSKVNTSKTISNQLMTDLERFKARQKQELLKMIESELRAAFVQQQNNLKMEIEKEKAQDKEYAHMQYQKDLEMQKKLYDQDKRKREEENYKQQQKAYTTYYQQEQQKLQEAKLKEQRHKQEIEEKEQLRIKKEEGIRLKALEFEKKKERELKQMEEERNEKERNRIAMQEYQQSQLTAFKEQKRIEHEKTMNETKKKTENELKEKEQKQQQKQNQIEEQRRRYEKEKEMIERQRIEKAKQTEKKHKDMIEYNTIRANARTEAINKKEEEMNEKKKQTEYFNQRNGELRKAALREREKKANETKEVNNYMMEQEKNSILMHLNSENEKTQLFLQRKEQMSKTQQQKNNLEETEMKMNVKRTEQLRQYMIESKEEEIKGRNDKIMENRRKKEEEMNEKKRLLKIKEEKRQKIQQEFDKIKNKNGALNFEAIKKLNPEDKEFKEKIEKMKKEYEEKSKMQIESYQRSKSISRQISAHETAIRSKQLNRQRKDDRVQTEGNDNNDMVNTSKTKILVKSNTIQKGRRAKTTKKSSGNKQEINEKKKQQQQKNNGEIVISNYPPINPKEKMTNAKVKFLVEQYQSKLMKDLLRFIEEKKKQNEGSNKLFNETTNENERKRLMTILKMERAQSSDKIGEYNKMIDVKLEEYKSELSKQL